MAQRGLATVLLLLLGLAGCSAGPETPDGAEPADGPGQGGLPEPAGNPLAGGDAPRANVTPAPTTATLGRKMSVTCTHMDDEGQCHSQGGVVVVLDNNCAGIQIPEGGTFEAMRIQATWTGQSSLAERMRLIVGDIAQDQFAFDAESTSPLDVMVDASATTPDGAALADARAITVLFQLPAGSTTAAVDQELDVRFEVTTQGDGEATFMAEELSCGASD